MYGGKKNGLSGWREYLEWMGIPVSAFDFSYRPSVPAVPTGSTFARSQILPELNRLSAMIQDGLGRARGTSLEARGRQLSGELAQAFVLSGRDPQVASRAATELTRRVHAWLRDVGNATVGGRRAFEEARRGASFTTQVERTVTEPIAGAVETVSPAAAEAIRSAGWVLPAAGGLLLFLLIRR